MPTAKNVPACHGTPVEELNENELLDVAGGIVTADLQDWVRKDPADLVSASSDDGISSGREAVSAEGKTKKG